MFIFLAIFAFGSVLGLTAYMLSLKKTPDVITQPDKPINPNPSDTSETDISDWKTYRNEEYGFEFKYPPALILEEEKDEKIGWSNLSVFMKSDDLNGYIRINDAGTGTGFGIPVSSENVLIGGLSSKLEILDSSVDNERAAKISFNKDNVEYYWLYRFDRNDSDKIAISKKILTTFKFIEKDETADWKTYQNKDYGISFKYPSNWLLKEDISVDKNTFSMWFSIEKPNTILTVVGISDEYMNEGPPGRYGYCASYKNVDQFCDEGCIKLNNSTATSRGIINRGDIGYSLLAYTDVSRNFSSICWDLDLSSLLSEISKKKNVSYYKVTNEDVETYLKEGSASEEMENVIKNFELLSRSIELF